MRSFCVQNFFDKEGGRNIFEILKKKSPSTDENISFQSWLKIDKIVENQIFFQDKSSVKIIKVLPINFKLKSELEQTAILNSYELFLKNLNSKIQIIVLSKKTDVSQHLNEILKNTKENPQIYEMSQDYIQLVKQLISAKGTITKEFYLMIPVTNNVENEIEKVKEYLEYCGNAIEICKKEQVLELLKNYTNKRVMNLVG